MRRSSASVQIVIGTLLLVTLRLFGAMLPFNAAAFGFVEIPLISFLMAPDRTRARPAAPQDRLRWRRRHAISTLLAALGCVLLGAGLDGR